MSRSITQQRMQFGRLMIVSLAAGVALSSRAADVPKAGAADVSAAAMETLKQKGLTKLKPVAGIVGWVLEDDAKEHEKLEPLRKAEAAQRDIAKKVHTDSVTTAKDRDVLSKAEKRYNELKPYADKPDTIPPQIARKFHSQQEMMKALNDDLSDAVNTINRLRPKLNGQFAGSMPPSLKTAIIDWMNARGSLVVAYLAAEPDFSELAKKYKELAEDEEVAAALKTLGKKNHLGSKDFEQDQKTMAAIEKLAVGEEVPFYREGMGDFLGGVLNETTPVAVRLESVNAQSGNWAPEALLTKAGITVDSSSPSVTLTFMGNGKRVIQCKQVIVPKLRLGKTVLENLKFLAMPDDAKDLGTQVMSRELVAYDLTPDVEKWIFKIVKKPQPKSEDDDDKPAKPSDEKSKPDADKAKPDAAKADKDDK